jgi:hypothetical protein
MKSVVVVGRNFFVIDIDGPEPRGFDVGHMNDFRFVE